jgi:DNA-binding NarL/FixJ family response regulator
MDVNMPVMDGIEATRELASRTPGTAVVVLSMQDDRATVARALAAGAVAFVGKRQQDGDLLAAIRMAARMTEGGALETPQTKLNELCELIKGNDEEVNQHNQGGQ